MAIQRSAAFEEQLRSFEQRCRDKGISLTVQRRTIAEIVMQRHDHPTTDQIYEDVRTQAPEISRATVYRTLETLVEIGAIRRAHYLGPASRFDANVNHHHHLVCMQCNSVVDYEDSQIDDLHVPEQSGSGFKIKDYSIHYIGVCEKCQHEERKTN